MNILNHVNNVDKSVDKGGEFEMGRRAYTIDEVSRYCSVPLATVKEWIEGGKIRSFKSPMGHRRIYYRDLNAFLANSRFPLPRDIQPGRKKILGVDDDPLIINVLCRIIKRLDKDLEVVTARDGVEAGTKFEAFNPDLVILDLKLPKLDGFTVCENIRSLGLKNRVKVLAMTGFNSADVRRRILDCGANDYIGKPFQSETLASKISDLLDLPKNKS